jgi:DNA adenine methylase
MPAQLLLFPIAHAVPFLKWAGGKSKYLKQLRRFFPAKLNRYVEPFLGGAAVYFYVHNRLRPAVAQLSDLNLHLIQCYEVVRDQCEPLIDRLAAHQQKHCPDYYYQTRSQSPETLSPLEAAARFIYLNKTCYNGLYRVNQDGEFNTPIGRYKDPKICEPDKLIAASRALAGANLRAIDFEVALRDAAPGDFVYLDPPYPPQSRTAYFTSYTPNEFGRGDQLRLAAAYEALDRRGCCVMLSQSDSELTRALYRRYRIEEILARRPISSNAQTRGAVRELVVLNY